MRFEALAKRYAGGRALRYDAVRAQEPEWTAEQAIVERLLAGFAPGTSILDVPAGTGRFLESYAKLGLVPTGMDISADMLAMAKAGAQARGIAPRLAVCDIRSLPLADKSVDAALCVRFVNWIDFRGMAAVLREIARVTRTAVILGIRVMPPPRSFAQWLGHRAIALRNAGLGRYYHDEEAVAALFEDLGFAVARSEALLPQRSRARYEFYLLLRRGDARAAR